MPPKHVHPRATRGALRPRSPLPVLLPSILLPLSVSLLAIFTPRAAASVTLYATPNTAGNAAPAQPTLCIGASPCDGNVLAPMPIPEGIANTVNVQLTTDGSEVGQLAQNVGANFFGFSIELSIADKLFGLDGNRLNPIFLNLLATFTARAGEVLMRVGGNTQELATVVPEGLPDGQAIEKVQIGTSRTFTPTLLISPALVYAMGNISELLPVKWFMGVPFNDTQNPRLQIAELSQKVLGANLLGLQLGNEPDLYHVNQVRGEDYSEEQFVAEWGTVLDAYKADPAITFPRDGGLFVAPSVCCGGEGNIGWTPEQVFDAGFLTQYGSELAYISVEHYPTNNCNGSGVAIDPATLLPELFLNHDSVRALQGPYANTAQIAAGLGKPLVMFETNTASCGGFSGLSDSFAAALWSVDYALSMAASGFGNALFHVGGQSDYYNPFTPPATNQTRFRQWSIGPTFYAALVVAEALGTAGTARVADLGLVSGAGGVDPNTGQPTGQGNTQVVAGYAVYEGGAPARVVLVNYLTDDGSGAVAYTANVAVGGGETGTQGATPAQVKVKYLRAPSTADKWNTTWAGQTFGGPFASDGRIQGTEEVVTIACDQANNVCAVPVPAPAVALVFLSDAALQEAEKDAPQTFATTYTAPVTGAQNTATVDQAVLATSNGRGGGQWVGVGSTSFGSANGNAAGRTAGVAAGVHVLLAVVGAGVLLWAWL